ncbi:MAG: hypothetical protein M1495_13840 [Bacteroidetes bacterium]|nr:hypothetical protein [Bacteroidota bacterium]
MKKKISIPIVISLVLILFNLVVAQDSIKIFRYPDANKMNVVAKSTIEKRPINYRYSYSLFSGPTSEQNATDFFIIRNAFLDSVKAPLNWIGQLDNEDKKMFWFSRDSLYDLLPNHQISGFVIYSKGLPSIIRFHLSGDIPIPELSEEPDSVENDNIFENSFKGWTVGPKDPPTQFVPVEFLDTLKSYLRQAYSLKWIVDKKENEKEKHDKEKEKDSGIVKELTKYLVKAREHLIKNKIKEAKKQLKEFVEKVENYYENDRDEEKERSEHGYLTSEAYALLKYNAEYLIQQLK